MKTWQLKMFLLTNIYKHRASKSARHTPNTHIVHHKTVILLYTRTFAVYILHPYSVIQPIHIYTIICHLIRRRRPSVYITICVRAGSIFIFETILFISHVIVEKFSHGNLNCLHYSVLAFAVNV